MVVRAPLDARHLEALVAGAFELRGAVPDDLSDDLADASFMVAKGGGVTTISVDQFGSEALRGVEGEETFQENVVVSIRQRLMNHHSHALLFSSRANL
jgi:hypothetical protein